MWDRSGEPSATWSERRSGWTSWRGPAARRRRLARALLPEFDLVAAAAVAISTGAPPWLGVAAMVTVPVAAVLGSDRYRSLGHALTGNCLVTRQGSLERRRDVLECDGIIGWNLRQTFSSAAPDWRR